MIITTDNPKFRPITIRIETRDDLDKLLAILGAVARNEINHTGPVRLEAMSIFKILERIGDQQP